MTESNQTTLNMQIQSQGAGLCSTSHRKSVHSPNPPLDDALWPRIRPRMILLTDPGQLKFDFQMKAGKLCFFKV